MALPLNGKIVIIDDKIEQAMPLMNALSKKKYSFSYFSGEQKYLPEENDNIKNDYRVVFLDINLIDDRDNKNSMLRSKLVPVLTRIISKNSYPYVLVYWSKHDNQRDMVEDIFNTDLSDRKPIAFLQELKKINYFNFDSTKTDTYDKSIDELFERIENLIDSIDVFNYLVHWENKVHESVNKTLYDIFSFENSGDIWLNNTRNLFTKMGIGYAGKKHYISYNPIKKIESSFKAFNNVFLDTLEYSVINLNITNPIELNTPIGSSTISTSQINTKLLISYADESSSFLTSGVVIANANGSEDVYYKSLINNLIHNKTQGIPEKQQLKSNIRLNSLWIIINLTPLCDFVQVKLDPIYNRFAKGVLIEDRYKEYIDDKTEAVFISPKFNYKDKDYILIIDFRHFYTTDLQPAQHLGVIFRVRQQLLAEIQSKLARHISRQGILFLE